VKILFVVSSINSKSGGLGGHFHSLIETVDNISKQHDVIIANIGNLPAKALEKTSHQCFYFIYCRGAVLRTYKSLSRLVDEFRPDILHAFDSLAYFWVRLVSMSHRIKCCMTKCGGINPIYSPIAESLILFSSENFDFYKNSRYFKQSRLSLIPNRIRVFPDDTLRINKLNNELNKSDTGFRFLRISRIGEYHQNSALQLVRLVKELNNSGIKCCAVFVGIVEDEKYLSQLSELGGNKTFFFLDNQYATNAKTLINCADGVLGTGRSLMEAASKGKLLLTPVDGWIYPAMITSQNFDQAFYYNFSDRTILDNESPEQNYNHIKETLDNPKKLKEAQHYSHHIFKQHFDSANITPKYEAVYHNAVIAKKHFTDLLLHWLFLMRAYFR
jgi:glycosyltransferase involved in cell wall biosynthesis